MKEVDYIIVGLGIAGMCFSEQLEQQGKSYVVLDEGLHTATAVAGGVVNPVVLKRFTAAWESASFLATAQSFYTALSKRLNVDFFSEITLHRILGNPQEQNDWLVASDKRALAPFLSSSLVTDAKSGVQAPFGYGAVKQALRIDTQKMLDSFKEKLISEQRLVSEQFQYEALQITSKKVIYKDYTAKQVVFAEGAKAINNPYFTIDALIPKKGEYVVIKAPELQLAAVLKGSYFVIPLGKDLYQVGATFAHGDTTYETTSKGREQLIEAISKIIDCPYTLVNQVAGMRPTVKDRRPLLGRLSNERIHFFNGLGARGLLMAPKLSKMLYNHIETGEVLPIDISIKRFL